MEETGRKGFKEGGAFLTWVKIIRSPTGSLLAHFFFFVTDPPEGNKKTLFTDNKLMPWESDILWQ